MVGLNPELFHLQTQTSIELASTLPIVYIGKPNQKITPIIDVSHLPSSHIISRTHAAMLFDDGNWFIQDIGSTNGTYVNNEALVRGSRYRLQSGDCIGLGHPDLVTFLFRFCFDFNAEITASSLRNYLMATTAMLERQLAV